MESDLKFNTFSGVFVPSVLAILGAVMYLIAPRVLGGVGLLKMIAIIVLAHAITFATAFSISAIATNIKVKGGGLYYLISRSLGREFGGSMGIQLYLAQTFGSAFYVIAFATAIYSILQIYYGISLSLTYIAMICLVVFFLISLKGAKFVIRIQYLILILIALSLISIFIAPNTHDYQEHLTGTNGISITFWVAFALFFPAVTGIDAGVGMSGELKNPRKSIVLGTFISITFTMAVYLALIFKMAYLTDPMSLSTDPMIAKNIAAFPIFVYIGILVATSSSALSYLMTGPRTLRALIVDKIFPESFSFLANSYFKSKEPLIALCVTFIIGEFVIFFGGLDLVSQIVAMFFLNVYGWINGAAFLEKLSNNPSYRPSFDAPWFISLFGMLACYFVMYLFNPYVMIGGILFQITIFYLLTNSRSSVRFESVWDGVLFQLLRAVLRRIEKSEESRKNWRPTIVSFAVNEKNHTTMISLLDWISSNRSIMKLYVLLKGHLQDKTFLRNELESRIKGYVKEYDFELFPRVIVTSNFEHTFETVIQSETLGNRPLNTILLDFDEKIKMHSLANITLKQKKNFILLRNQGGYKDFKKIDVWWSNEHNGNLGILIAYLITHSKKWKIKDPVIRVIKIIKNKKDVIEEGEKINKMINQSRIENIEVIILTQPEENISEVIHETSCYSDLVIIGLPRNKRGIVDKKGMAKIKKMTDNLNTTLIVSAYDQIDFKVN
jgi:amino acid transporter